MTPEKFNFELPTRVVFGLGAAEHLGEEIRRFHGGRILLVCDPGIIQVGLTARIEKILCGAGAAVETFSGVSSNPRDTECLAGVAAARSFRADVLVGLGGGSAMDAAKAIGVLVANGGRPQDWADGRRPITQRPPPLVCIPTTAGTGSEVTPVAVITDTERRCKIGLEGALVAPPLAILDPELTVGLPPEITAATGMDALTHAVEAFTCRRANPVSDALALAALEHIVDHLTTAVRSGTDRSAREHMLLGSLLAGMAFGQADVGAVHSMAESLGGAFDVPHGLANAIFLPHVMAYNLNADLARHARLGRILDPEHGRVADADAARAGVFALRRLAADLAMPSLFQVLHLDAADIERLAEMAAAHPCTAGNARGIGRREFVQLFESAYHGKPPDVWMQTPTEER